MWFYLEVRWKRVIRKLAERWASERRVLVFYYPMEEVPEVTASSTMTLGTRLDVVHRLYRFAWSWVSLQVWYRQVEYRLTHTTLTSTGTTTTDMWSVCGVSKVKAYRYLKQRYPRLTWETNEPRWYLQKRQGDQDLHTSNDQQKEN